MIFWRKSAEKSHGDEVRFENRELSRVGDSVKKFKYVSTQYSTREEECRYVKSRLRSVCR